MVVVERCDHPYYDDADRAMTKLVHLSTCNAHKFTFYQTFSHTMSILCTKLFCFRPLFLANMWGQVSSEPPETTFFLCFRYTLQSYRNTAVVKQTRALSTHAARLDVRPSAHSARDECTFFRELGEDPHPPTCYVLIATVASRLVLGYARLCQVVPGCARLCPVVPGCARL